ncbi:MULTISPECIES: hypothetical protein [unclassified Tatumella]|uniref:hypothetical protein n=1 Tax=unclassified Tatumella TaxID=2649542 RepID=UPI001BAED4ED|nr:MULTISPECIES: hypothetical protein [unclassified Tatumella]MBS0877066.1 hypothetical protein [Tatumella sp. JGM82]MBS0890666.1 hypothetical protein [Tatumella sp. JGM94]MBS0901369.1 hypothetical protein [Tatumella sp. JGM100]
MSPVLHVTATKAPARVMITDLLPAIPKPVVTPRPAVASSRVWLVANRAGQHLQHDKWLRVAETRPAGLKYHRYTLCWSAIGEVRSARLRM